jgi:hypothetical protein
MEHDDDLHPRAEHARRGSQESIKLRVDVEDLRSR